MSQMPISSQETKYCGRCNAPFECRVGHISECQCSGIRLTDESKAFIAANYTDCLCRDCLLAIAASHPSDYVASHQAPRIAPVVSR